MFSKRGNGDKKEESVVVAIDKDKGSQYALKWAVDNLLGKGQYVTLLHVNQRPSSSGYQPGGNHNMAVSDVSDKISKGYKNELDTQAKELFLPFRCFCTRKSIRVNEVIVEGMDIVKALCDYVKQHLIQNLVTGASTRSGLVRKSKAIDIPAGVSKAAAEFCNVYVIAKGKIAASRPAAFSAPHQMQYQSSSSSNNNNHHPGFGDRFMQGNVTRGSPPDKLPALHDTDFIKSPFNRGKATTKPYGELSLPDTDISFVSSGRPSADRLLLSSSEDIYFAPRHSTGSEMENRFSFGSPFAGSSPQDSSTSWSSSTQSMDDVEAEMRRLKQELKQTMDMYSTACKEALTAKQKAMELHRWKVEEQQKLEEAKLGQEAALAIAEKEKAKCKAAIEAAEASQRIAELEAQKRINAERKALKEAEERKKVLNVLAHSDVRYRKYSIEDIETATENFSDSRKIGEGGYGPVYKSYLDHTPVAIKVLRPDAAQGQSQFQQEVEVLSCIRHPNMVLLLGACPENGCLVYEYMANGSLDDCLFRREDTPALPWQFRFRIAAEISTGLLFLHQSKPEPLVHRDLKPANILLDRNYVSKISDVGLARLVPPSVADSVTQYLMTSTAGTFCYIDPEYQQTGMLGIKSDIYSLGVVLLQIITAKAPMGLTHHVERAIENGTFADMLDPAVTDWPVAEALNFAKLALKCAQMRRKDRPDLGREVLPLLNRLRELAEETMPNIAVAHTQLASGHENASGLFYHERRSSVN